MSKVMSRTAGFPSYETATSFSSKTFSVGVSGVGTWPAIAGATSTPGASLGLLLLVGLLRH